MGALGLGHLSLLYSSSGFWGEEDVAANINRKSESHDRKLDERAGQNHVQPDYRVAEREAVSQQKLKQNEEMDVQQVGRTATGGLVVDR